MDPSGAPFGYQAAAPQPMPASQQQVDPAALAAYQAALQMQQAPPHGYPQQLYGPPQPNGAAYFQPTHAAAMSGAQPGVPMQMMGGPYAASFPQPGLGPGYASLHVRRGVWHPRARAISIYIMAICKATKTLEYHPQRAMDIRSISSSELPVLDPPRCAQS